MANSRAFLVCGFLGVAMALSTTLSSATPVNRTHSVNYHSVSFTGGSYTLHIYDLGICAEPVRMPDNKIVYARPENAPKYNNRLNGHAQEWRDQNVKAKIVFS